jgi:hypothetical protein
MEEPLKENVARVDAAVARMDNALSGNTVLRPHR